MMPTTTGRTGRPTGRPSASLDQIAEIRRLRFDEKKSVAEVMVLTGFGKDVISIYANPNPFTAEEEAVAKRLEAGESQVAIAKTLTRHGAQSFVSKVFRRMIAEKRLGGSPRQTVAPAKSLYPPKPTATAALDSVLGSHRDRVLAYLTEHPNETFTSRDIAKAIDAPITKVEYSVDSLRKMNKVDADRHGTGKGGHASSARRGTAVDSGDHETWFNIQIKKVAVIKEIAAAISGKDPEAVRVAKELTDARVRESILTILSRDHEPVGDTAILRARLKAEGFNGVEYFDLNRLLVNIERIGLVRFRRDRHGKTTSLRRIAITDAGLRSIGLLPRAEPPVAASGPVERIKPDIHGPVPEDVPAAVPLVVPVAAVAPVVDPATSLWPVLMGLRKRADRATARASLLRQAAALADDDKERSELELYAEATIPSLSDVEREYLDYAKEAEGAIGRALLGDRT